MGVDWDAIFSDSRPLGGSEISKHAAIHSSREGFKFRNPPKGQLRSEWRRLLRSGGPLYDHWDEGMSEHRISQSYILAPFLGSFIFFSPMRLMSGDRPVTEIYSRISQDYDSLAIEVANDRGGVAIPPPHSIGSGKTGPGSPSWLGTRSDGVLEVESSHDSGLGISTLLFQPQGFRDITGVACGVDRAVLEECFPEVNLWILETVTNTVDGPPKRGRSPLQSMVAHGAGDPLETLERFRTLETLWHGLLSAFPPDVVPRSFENMISVHEKDEGRASPINPTTEIKMRMALGDREGSLQLLEPDSIGGDRIDLRDRCANGWMPLARDEFDGVNFPFSHSELSILEKGPTERCVEILEECLMSMVAYDEYDAKSKITMVRILTKHANQNQIEGYWKAICPIGQKEVDLMEPSILEWRDNPKINDFWGLLIMLEGEGGGKNLNFRRNLCHKITYQSANEHDLNGIIRYIPDLIYSKGKLELDWLILDRLGLDKSTIIQRINHAQPSDKKIQQRIILSIGHIIRSDSWQLGGLIPSTSQILYNHLLIEPILGKIYERKKIYKKECYPDDAFHWISVLSPKQYLFCSGDPVLRRYIALDYPRSQSDPMLDEFPRPSSSWPLPKAMPVGYTTVEANYFAIAEDERKWARLVAAPKFEEKLSYRWDLITRYLSYLSFVCLVVCLLSPITILANFKDDLGPYAKIAGFALSLSFLGIVFFAHQILERFRNPNRASTDGRPIWIGFMLFLASALFVILRIGPSLEGFDIIYQEFGGLPIPIPNNPVLSGILVAVFWKAYWDLSEESDRASDQKSNFLNAISNLSHSPVTTHLYHKIEEDE